MNGYGNNVQWFVRDGIIILLTIVIVGGLASLRGTFYGVFITLLLPEVARFLSLPPSLLGPLRQIAYALALILILRFVPRGLKGKVDIR